MEGSAQGEDAAGVRLEVAVEAGVQGRAGDEAAHGVRDEDEPGFAFVDPVAAGAVVGGMRAPGGEVGTGGFGEERPLVATGRRQS